MKRKAKVDDAKTAPITARVSSHEANIATSGEIIATESQPAAKSVEEQRVPGRSKADPAVSATAVEAEKKPGPPASEPARKVDATSDGAKAEPLTTEEAKELKECERVIEQGLRTPTDVGKALASVNGKKLYRATHESFEAYCEDVWKMERTHAYRLIRAAGVVDDIERQTKKSSENQKDQMWPIGHSPALMGESVMRPLAKLKKPEERFNAFQKALELAGPKPLTAAIVQEAVSHRPKTAKKQADGAASGAPQGNVNLNKALDLVNEIGRQVQESGDSKTILNLVNQVRIILMDLQEDANG